MKDPTYPYSRPKKDVEKELYKAMKICGKEYGFKKVENYLWKQDHDFLIKADCFLSWTKKGINLWGSVKSLAEDSILWDILGMPGNKEQPFSLRIRGAFTSGGYILRPDGENKKAVIPIESDGELEKPVETALTLINEKAHSYLESIEYDPKKHFEALIASDDPLKTEPFTLKLLIVEIGLGNYQKAYDLSKNALDKGIDILHFGIGDKSDLELVMEYCERKLAE